MDSDRLEVPVERVYPPDQVTRFATEFYAQPHEDGCFLSFFELRPPLLLGDEEQKRRQLQTLGAVEVECVARLAVTQAMIPRMIAALEEIRSDATQTPIKNP